MSEPKVHCPCPRLKCERRGRCLECREYHRQKKKIPPSCEQKKQTKRAK